MFTIQYEAVDGSHKMQEFNSKDRTRLLLLLSNFEHPIMAVYEQASPITKAVRKELKAWIGVRSMSHHARAFAKSQG